MLWALCERIEMFRKLVYLATLALCIGLGIAIEWIHSYHETQDKSDKSQMLEKVLTHANIQILEENYSCDGKPVQTVGAVIASIIEFNSSHSKNMVSYGCYNETCTISYTDCKPWQSSECSSRFLKFQLNETGNIKKNSFSCFDMP
ncbi:hypothetical protein [Rheinheimera sp. WS51]|uniref:hypothetical protein n=1 Tax=Rheinheimera sp. WS51 TaxID=3425886 RepID=UPI003D8C6DA8